MIQRICVISICVLAVFFASQPVIHNQYYVSAQEEEESSSARVRLRISEIVSHSVSLLRLHRSLNGHDTEIVYEQLYEQYDNEIVKSPPLIVALTFDDGPAAQTELILDILEYHDVIATFCVVGERIRRYESTLLRTFESGHEIVGHSWNHRRFTLLGRDAIKDQLVRTNDEIYRVLGITPALHRPPYGAMNNTVLEVSEELDMAILSWSVDPRDWKYSATSEGIYEHIMEYVFDGAILLFHDVHDVTVYAIEKIIPSLLERGFVFMSASELLSHSEYPIEGGRVFRYAIAR